MLLYNCIDFFITNMCSDILGVFTKVNSVGCKIVYGHDSPHCENCLRGKLHITPKIKYSLTKKDVNLVDDEEPESVFKRIRLAPVLTQESIPKNSYSYLGINLTQAVISKLKLKNNYKIPQVVLTPIEKLSSNKQLPQRKNCKSPKNGCRTCDYKKTELSTNKKPKIKLRKQLIKKHCSPLKTSKPKVLVKQKKSDYLKSPSKKSITRQSPNKEPNRGTLKRRRWNLQKLKKSNLNYEDDLFEDQKFCDFKTMDEENSNSDKYDGMLTPEISLSPIRDDSSSPSCHDCYSPTELFSNRKEAEEYIYRREKRRRLKLQDEKNCISSSPGTCKKNETNTKILLEETSKILKKLVLKAERNNEVSDEDEYFSDISNDDE